PADLVAGNGLIEAGTFIGILLGTLAGSALITTSHGAALTAGLGLFIAGLGIVFSHKIPPVPAAQPGLRLRWNLPAEITTLLTEARSNRPVWFAILGISWFWALGASLLAEFPVLAHDQLHASAHVVSAMFGVFAIGIGIGSLAIARFGHRASTLTPVAVSGLAVTVFTADFALTGRTAPALPSLSGLLASLAGWHLLADLLLLAVCGGAFSVPLYVRLQKYAAPSHRARMIGANNVVNALASVAAAGLTAALYAAGLRAPAILLILAMANAAIAAWIWRYQGIFVPS
ncbi:MAG: MFS transporter, partial [Acidocella sp.]|nr:MFS transporter [Acidocella sp.]